tara:strand:- start:8000 stop:8224 length:225 start_codon:yes stop_codon:yes gene_type:complete
MLNCKNKVFKKLLLFSFIFLFFSLFCNKVMLADVSKKIIKIKDRPHQVTIQQKEIISSLKKIEDNITQYKEKQK